MARKIPLDLTMAARLLEPGPVTLLTSCFRSTENVMTLAWATPVSFDPPRIAVAIQPDRLTHELVSGSEFLALNVPTAELLSAVHRCGIESGREYDKFERAALTPGDPQEIEVPLIDECVGHIELGVIDRISYGDHDLFIAQALSVQALDEAFSDRWLVALDAGQVLHHLRAEHYATLSRPYSAELETDEE